MLSGFSDLGHRSQSLIFKNDDIRFDACGSQGNLSLLNSSPLSFSPSLSYLNSLKVTLLFVAV